MDIFNHLGQRITLANELGRGGEGAVFSVATDPKLVAKVYHKPVNAEKSEKLKAMQTMAVPEILAVSAWPLGTLHPSPGGPVIGCLQPKATGYEIHTLFGPNSRAQTFPKADWRFLIHVAMNCAAAFQTIHGHGHVVGDVNSKNVWVTDNGTIRLVDCDSFQIIHKSNRFLCEVGVDSFTPPELQGKPFTSQLRTPNHDAFGLSILIFQLLLVGRHPYAGRFAGSGDMPIDKAIRENRYVFGSKSRSFQMTPPPFVPAMTSLPSEISNLFELAFAPDSHLPGRRPIAQKWWNALESLRRQISLCPIDSGHSYYAGLPRCPWCNIIESNGPNFFVSVVAVDLSPATLNIGPHELQHLWRRFGKLTTVFAMPKENLNGAVGVPLSDEMTELFETMKIMKWMAMAGSGLTVIVLLGCLIATNIATVVGLALVAILTAGLWGFWFYLNLTSPLGKEIARRQSILDSQLTQLNRLRDDYDRAVADNWHQINETEQFLSEQRTVLTKMASAYEQECQGIQKNAYTAQLNDFLDRHFIDGGRHGIPKSVIVSLISYDVETARDVDYDKIMAVPGIGQTWAAKLLEWRCDLEKTFNFDERRALPEREARKLMMRYRERKRSIIAKMSEAIQLVETSNAAVKNRISTLTATINDQVSVTAQAKADLDLCKAYKLPDKP